MRTIHANVPGGEIEVGEIKHGETITKPGVYDIPMGWYHSDCCAGPSISSSGLRKIYHYSPAHYWHSSYLNPERDEETEDAESKALRLGKAAHTLMLEPHLFRQHFVTRPPIFPDWRTKKAREWRAEKQVEGFTVLDPDDMQLVVGVHDSLREHEVFKAGILDGDIELSIIWQDEKTGVWLKVRPDAIPRGSNVIADLKVTNDCRDKAVSRKIFDMGYDMQMALIGIGFREVLKREVEEFVLVNVESKRPHGVRIAPIFYEEIERALAMLRFSLNTFKTCLDESRWPSFEREDNEYVHRNSFQNKLIDADMTSGRLPKEW